MLQGPEHSLIATFYKSGQATLIMKNISPFIWLLLLAAVSVAAIQIFNEADYAKADVIKLGGPSGNTLTIGSGCKGIVADTSPERAQAIAEGLGDVIIERPSVYDVYVDTVKSFNISIDRVVLEKYDGQYYYSNIFVNSGNKILKIDSKPSDAVAVALRAKAPVYIKRDLLEKEGKNIC